MSNALPRTAIVIGAGCSLGLGIPTMPTFMDEAFDRLARDAAQNPPLKRTLEALLAFTRRIKNSAAAVNTRFLDVEELYGLAEMANDLEALKGDLGLDIRVDKENSKVEGDELLRHFRRTLMYMCVEAGRELIENDEYNRIAERIEEIKRESQSEDPDLFTERGSRHANLLAYLGLASFKDIADEVYPLVIPFNWDLAFDRALYAYFRAQHKNKHGELDPEEYERTFSESSKAEAQYWKVGWAQYGNASDHDFTKHPLVLRPHGGLHFQTDVNNDSGWSDLRLVKVKDSELYLYEQAITKWLKRPGKDVFPKNGDISPDLRSGDAMAIEPPTWKKDVTHFLNQWQLMLKYLRSVRRIVFIGYSLPRSDLYMRHFLALALAEADYVPRVTVWNPEMRLGTETWNNYCDAFAPLRRQGRLYALPRRFGDPALFDLERALHLAEPVLETL